VLDGELRRVTKSTFVLSPRKGEVSEDGEIARRDDRQDSDYL
jgi:FtsZ-interacting cell division protein YlmF